jgi:hypothetical protein
MFTVSLFRREPTIEPQGADRIFRVEFTLTVPTLGVAAVVVLVDGEGVVPVVAAAAVEVWVLVETISSPSRPVTVLEVMVEVDVVLVLAPELVEVDVTVDWPEEVLEPVPVEL